MIRRRLHALTLLAAFSTAAIAQDSVPNAAHRAFPEGSDFCFARAYDVKHLAAHPRQIVTSLQIMGRNAWLADPVSGSVHATLVAQFRDRAKSLVMHGACWRGDEAEKLQCKFVPKGNPDILEIGIQGTLPKPDVLRAEIGGDWKTVRRGLEPTYYDGVTTDDTTFLLNRRPASACAFPAGFWTAKGPTKKFMEQVP
ncbi:MAG: hypothetical protein JWN71_2020 [Xanthobacteraceae bacterium]|nr:hypothetical protein [Xanthobacteraceae bacterium]